MGNYIILLPYIAVLIFLPFQIEGITLLIICFFTGGFLDFFYDTSGIHASACLLLGFARRYILKILAPREGYEIGIRPCVEDFNLQWFITYAGTLVLIHHLYFFFLEAFRFNEIFRTLFRVILSSIGTFAMLYALNFLFYKPRQR
ncbi:MAG: rod shape-determining protein MreD [Bacteroidetes bacterium]|nr:rod shape-determining protein MreD [Bacteroidota bacterium]